MDVIEYSSQMENEVIDLFIEEYGFEEKKFAAHFKNQLDHPFQENKAFRIVAIDDGVIKGFMSFIFWPIAKEGGGWYNSYQCGNVIVGTKFRGQRVFGTMLKALNNDFPQFCYDFIIGFPVEASFPGFIRSSWITPFQLNWYVKLHRPLRALFTRTTEVAKNRPSHPSLQNAQRSNFQPKHATFKEYRESIRQGHYYDGSIKNEECSLTYSIKIQRRGKFLTEGIIGQIEKTDGSMVEKRHIHWVLKDARKRLCVSFFSVAIPSASTSKSWNSAGFRRFGDRKIHFILKPGAVGQPEEIKALLRLGRADVDTW